MDRETLLLMIERVKEHERRVSDEIDEWKRTNSQSNPGAVFELRALRQALQKYQRQLQAMKRALDEEDSKK